MDAQLSHDLSSPFDFDQLGWLLPPAVLLGGSAGIRLDFLPPYQMMVLRREIQDEPDTPEVQTLAEVR